MSEKEKPLPVVCRLLRTKASFGSEQGASWQRGDSNTDVFWCLNTMESVGPDDSFVHAHECRKGRACFQVPAEHDDNVA
jgi:hypothetical protein